MFSCTLCPVKYDEQDIKEGLFFISTSTCLKCYKSLDKNKSRCFGKEKMFNVGSLVCQECPDYRICKTFIHHRKEFKGE